METQTLLIRAVGSFNLVPSTDSKKLQVGDGGVNENFLKQTMLRPWNEPVPWFDVSFVIVVAGPLRSLGQSLFDMAITNEEIPYLAVPFSKWAEKS